MNVFTPSTDPMEPAPVVVFLHGGDLQWGSISDHDQVPTVKTAKDLHTVFVNVQYRFEATFFLL